MATIPIGTTGEFSTLVTGELAINFLGLEGARVLGTPFLIGLLEMTCRNSVLPLLEPGADTVGTHVDVKHLAATPLGMQVTFRSVVTAVEDRRIQFRVEAFDEREKVAEGTHERFLINVERFAARLAAKLNN
jgi:predicted thioesterase